MVERLDCPAMCRFCQAAAPLDPALAAGIARRIPDSRELTRSLGSALQGPGRTIRQSALALVGELPSAAERSAALLAIVDQALGTGDLPWPGHGEPVQYLLHGHPAAEPAAAAECACSLPRVRLGDCSLANESAVG